jgi:hypothetical protein
MNTKVTTQPVRDSAGNIRELLVSTVTGAGRPESVEYRLGVALVEEQADGTFKVADTGEVLTLPDA